MSKKCFHCIRIAVVVVNFILLLIGIAIIGSSIFLYIKTTNYDLTRAPDHYSDFKKVLSVIMGIGIFTVILSSVGCIGAYNESQAVLSIYFIIMLVLFGNQIAVGCMYFVYKYEKLSTSLKISIDNYNSQKIENQETIFINSVQKMLKCCGVDGVSDYKTKKDTQPKIPFSCCNYEKFACSSKDPTVDVGNAFTKGCKEKYKEFSQHKLGVISMIIIVMSITEFLGMLFAISMCFAIRYSFNNGYEAVTRNMII